jgi:hypothetical protein
MSEKPGWLNGIMLYDTWLANGGGSCKELEETLGAFDEWVKYGANDVDCTYEVNGAGYLIRVSKPKE